MDAVSGRTVGQFTTNRGTTPTIPHLWLKYNPFILRLQGIFYRSFSPFPLFFRCFFHFFHDLQNICSRFDAQKKKPDTTSCVRLLQPLLYILPRIFSCSKAPLPPSKRTKEGAKFRQFSLEKNQTSSLTSAVGCIFSAEAARKRMRDSFTSSTAAWMASSVRRRASSA